MASVESLATRVIAADRRAVADALTLLERDAPSAPALLAALGPHLGRAAVIGVTGPPGAGKSTLVNALIGHWRRDGHRVGVIAVDPSSPVSGGAILGDRVRMTAAHDDDGVFVRSLAARGALGGLSPAAVRLIDVLDAAGFARILIETVGTGQNEIDVAEIADVRVVVSAPGLGDAIQAIKAGLLEIADVMVVNKADREGADQTAGMLLGALRLQEGRADVAVLRASALSGAGVAEVSAAIEQRSHVAMATFGSDRRRRRARYLIQRRAVEIAAAVVAGTAATTMRQLSDEVLAGTRSVDEAARQLMGRAASAGSDPSV